VEHRQVEARQTKACRASGDDPARFLQELRQLRDGAGLGPAELAARAHYPYDRIRAAEAGPALPDLPVLSAYVRGCGGTSEEWEERWRSLTSAPTLPLLAARPAGTSTAADAGARIGSISPAADTPDPSIILAALDRVAEGMAVGDASVAAPSKPVPAWETDQAAPGGESEAGSAEAPPWSTAAAPTAAEPTTASLATASLATASPAPVTRAPTPTPAPATAAAAAAGQVVGGSTRPALSRTAIAAVIAVLICVLIAALAIFA
jgi:Helix-turn-helix domain